MAILRIAQQPSSEPDQFPVELSIEGLGARQTATAQVQFTLSEADRNRIRWYLEDYLEKNAPPMPIIAASVENRLREIGAELFTKIFEYDRDSLRLWGLVC